MRRVSIAIIILLSLTVSGFSQISNSAAFSQAFSTVASAISYGSSASIVDPHGNLLIFDTVSLVTPLTSTGTATGSAGVAIFPIPGPGMPIKIAPTPKTRVTVVPGGTGKPTTVEYPASFQVIGAGKWAAYAVATAYTLANNQLVTGPRRLIAIDAGAGGNLLPADLSGFLSADVRSNADVKLTPSTDSSPDTISSVDQVSNPILVLIPNGPTGTTPVAVRIARTIRFDGTRFTSTDVTLP